MTHTRDIVVVGTSMGGLDALTALAGQLPADLPAALLVVLHTAQESPAVVAELLARRGALPAVTAEDGMEPERGRIHVAPPDRHMLLTKNGIRIVFGPRENRSRPAIDPLFRTAAVNYRSRVIGVILTGLLNDGAAGLQAVSRCGGAAVIQSPDDAAHPEMPLQALAAVGTAHQVALDVLGLLLEKLIADGAPEPPAVPESLEFEARLTERAMNTEDWHQLPGTATDFTCPECGGAVHQIDRNGMQRFRCRVGHAFTTEALLAENGRAVEETLWVALQTLQERAHMLEQMERHEQQSGRRLGARALSSRAREARQHADRLRNLLATLAR